MSSILLFLSDVSGSEVFLILLVILIFFGSKSIPGIARTAGRTMRQIRDASDEMKAEIRKSGGDLKKDFSMQNMLNDTKNDLEQPFDEITRTLDQDFVDQASRPFPYSRPQGQPIDQDQIDIAKPENDSIKEN